MALTRARHALWVGWSAVKRGNGKACVNHDSAPGHLLGGGQPLEAAQWLPQLQALQTAAQGAALPVQLAQAPSDVPLTRLAATCTAVGLARGFAQHRPHRQELDDCQLFALDAGPVFATHVAGGFAHGHPAPGR